MKKMKFVSVLLAMCLVFGSCNMSNTGKGALIGGGSGAAVGAGLGAIFGKGKGAAIGAVGTTAGVLIGKKMDKARAEAAALEGAKAEDVTDANGLQAVKVTFDSGILFAFNSSTLSQTSKNSLRDFSKILIKNPTIDVAIYGHTDNIGTEAANMKVSTARANAVESYLMSCGVPVSQIKITEGKGYTEPVASNETKAGQAQNRRVEVYLYASEAMIKEAEAGTLK